MPGVQRPKFRNHGYSYSLLQIGFCHFNGVPLVVKRSLVMGEAPRPAAVDAG